MKRLLFLMAAVLTIAGCSKSDEEEDDFYQRQVTKSELESGTATYEQGTSSTTHYLIFKDGNIRLFDYKQYGESSTVIYKYEVVGDSIYFINIVTNTQEAAYVNFIHWGDGAKGKGDQILIRSREGSPYLLKDGYYSKSGTSLF